MRILFTFMGGNGHFQPLVPVAKAAATAGHIVAFGCDPSMVETVTAVGFTTFTLSTGASSRLERRALLPLDPAREAREFRDRFARADAQYRAPITIALCAEWRPDILVCDDTDFGCMIAAERRGLPYASVLVMAAGFVRADVVGEALGDLRAEHGLPPDPDLEMLSRYLVLSPFPASYRDPGFPLPTTAHMFRAITPDPKVRGVTPVASRPTNLPTVYFTLGTIFNMASGDLFERVLVGLRELSVNIVVTVGSPIDPAKFGPQPANIQIERYIPQAAILPRCRAVVSHGGSGSVLGALAHGLPSVLIPMGADQPLNAARCVNLGIGLMLDPIDATPESVRAAVAIMLYDSTYRRDAARFCSEIAAMPGPEQSVMLMERLVRERRPITNA